VSDGLRFPWEPQIEIWKRHRAVEANRVGASTLKFVVAVKNPHVDAGVERPSFSACHARGMQSCRVAPALRLAPWSLPFLLLGLFACRTTKPQPVQEQVARVVKPHPDEPGRRVSIGGPSMYIECAGPGSPTVVFEAGLGGNAGVWEGVIAGVRRETRACRYDRLGTGRSDAAPRPHTPVEMALELSELLAAANERPPLILVGHSLGGIIARLYVQNNPSAVVGLVLVESMHEDQQQRVGALAPEAVQQQERAQLETNREGLTSESLSDGLAALRRGERSLGSRPLVVISGGLPPRALPGLSEEAAQRMWAERQALQVELTHLSSNSVQIIAQQSGHAIPRDQPQLVVAAALEVVRAVRQGARVEREPVLAGAARARP
jgi:pimeloyl-ACP methyl ester carboxylesterase